jgi:hypothetical protein
MQVRCALPTELPPLKTFRWNGDGHSWTCPTGWGCRSGWKGASGAPGTRARDRKEARVPASAEPRMTDGIGITVGERGVWKVLISSGYCNPVTLLNY